MLFVYYPVREKTRKRVNYKLEPIKLLTTYKKNTLDEFKADQKETKKRCNGFKCKLAKRI